MGTGIQVKLDDYLQNLSDSSCEYVDGHLIEKPMPTWMHSILQGWISALIMRAEPSYRAGTEVHVRLRQAEFRIPSIAVQLRSVVRTEQYAEQPPILCIEILSPEDRLGATFAKCELYHDWGVPVCWVIDPMQRRVWLYKKGSEPELQTSFLSIGIVQIALADIFSPLD